MELLPCPMCGGKAVLAWTVPRKNVVYWVVCNECPVRLDRGGRWSEDEVVRVWNRRVELKGG